MLDSLVVPDRDPIRGIIPIEKLAADLLVEVPKGAEFRNSLSIQLFINNDFGDPDNHIGEPVNLESYDLSDPTLIKFDLYYKTTEFPGQGMNTTVSLNYYLFDTDSEHGEAAGVPVMVRFDRQFAGGDELPPIAFTDDQLSGITASDLDDDGKLNVIIDPYHLGEESDVVELWLGDSAASGSYLAPTYTVTDPKMQLPVSFTREQLDAVGDAQAMYFGYRVTDFAGNESPLSNVTAIDVFINLPSLEAPVVPEAADGLVTYNDAIPSVAVEIPRYDGAALNDRIVVVWGGLPIDHYELTQADIDRDPDLPVAFIEVPYATVATAGDGAAIPVLYQMTRGVNPMQESPPVDVPVNLRTPGGPDPDPNPELPEHGNIRLPSILCGASPVNTIEPTDFGKDAVATAYRQGTDNSPIWLVGDVIQMHWGTISNPEIASITVIDSNEGANIPIPIPFTDVIEAIGVGSVETWFTLTRQLPVEGGGSVPVTVRSPIQKVQVTSSNALPGDGNQLAAGDFWEKSARNIINAEVGGRGTSVRIPLTDVSNIGLALNPTISYNFVGVESGDQSGPPTPPGAEIEQSRITATDVPLEQSHIDDGFFEVALPYAITYYICRNGAKLNYSLANDFGRNSNHVEAFVRFAMNAAGGLCKVPTFAKASGVMASMTGAPPKHALPDSDNSLPPIAFTEEQRSGISEDDLEQGVLVAAVNPYFGVAKGDVIEPWVGTSEAESSGIYLSSSTVEDPDKKTPINFAGERILAVGNNQRLYFGYRVTDKDGEVSGLSRLVGIQVNIESK
ncbi:hypothetical protein [Pseudomonas sp. KU43P]|uniref:hypothetical protein n=1 Tax=Pseudomonas sp. KU43P TaxID=2487887 RepID=UPI0012A97F44|nr:hypothetical protein [Pseudomonas sp. KU43P]BBH44393.1 hypothetical protein KU43P_08700 [Pseudomonas sp. KU43P]